jgi:osmotically-inducible protein OsmY
MRTGLAGAITGGIACVVICLAPSRAAFADESITGAVRQGPLTRFASLNESSDASVTERVKSKLATNTNTRDLHIDVNTKNRVVTLRGEVWSSEERDLAELLARNIAAVAMVRNDLIVRDRGMGRQRDSDRPRS